MTLQQMEYIVALDKYRHFVLAAEACGVTQPTLSAMIQKLEEELDVKIFNIAQRNVSILIKVDFIRERMVNAVLDTIKAIIPAHMMDERFNRLSIKLR